MADVLARSRIDRPCRGGEIFWRVAVLEIMPSNQCDQLALHIGVAVDVPLSRLNRPVTSEQLDIAQRTTGFVDEPRRPGDERPPSGMRRAAVEANVAKRAIEPDYDTQWRHRPAALGLNDGPTPVERPR